TFSIAKVIIPFSNSSSIPIKYASGYEWTIPSGWTGPDGKTGTFLIDNPDANIIQLNPNGCSEGQIRVRAYTNTEGKGEPHYSQYSPYYLVERKMPEISTSTSDFRCKIPFTASISGLTCANSYTWNVPSGWVVSGTGASVTITPSNNDGPISVTAQLSGTSCSSQTSTRQIQITNDIQSIIGQDNGACGTTFSAGSLPPGSSISWTYSSNLQRINSGSSPSLQVVPTNPSSYAPGWVKAYVTNPNGCDFEKTRTIWVGIPGLPSTSFQSFNVYGGGTFSAPSFAGSTTGYTWTVSSSLTVVSGGGVNDNTITVSINPNQTYGDIFVRARNSCGSSQQPSQIRVNRIQSFNYSAYPNPVINELTIEAEKIDTTSRELQPFEVKIYDESGNEIFNRKMKNAKNKISVNGFKGGFYYLHIISEDGIIRKKIKIEK
ncbi:MAG: T9SS type A sorting domain-containing protein, partial [Algoriphagus sp.]